MHTHWGLALAWLIANTAFAAEDSSNQQHAAQQVTTGVSAGPEPDEAAAEAASEDGIWSWIDRMGGEVPTRETIEALEELAAELASEDKFEAVSGNANGIPTGLYKDPVAAASTDPEKLDLIDVADFDIPIETNEAVRKWIRYFTGSGRKHFTRYLRRSALYEPMILAELKARGLPSDLRYIAMIESGYNPHAYSHAGAAGLWQFIPSTGRLYDMRVDWWVDDRRDPAKATVAATEYLIDLNKMFSGNWELAWAAYNGGPGRVRSAMKRSGAKNFWQLVDADILHSETENYVPKIMAAAIVSRYAERYGFEVPKSQPLAYQVAQVEGSVALSVIAEAAALDEEQLRRLNPGLRRFATPPEGYGLRVPVGTRDRVLAKLAEIPAEERVEIVRHTVKKGETLSSIASRYSVPVDVISRTNRLKNVDRIYVGLELVIPTTESAARVSSAGSAENQGAPSTYTVREGDSLSRVAARYGVTIDDLRRWNSIDGSTIFVGQQLTMRGATAPTVESTHKVASGESLSGIASRYGVTVRELQDWNGIRNPSHIQVGQALKVRTAAPQWREYTVRKGDSLGAIANREGCSVNDIVGWNSLGSTTIHPGQVLRLQ